MRALASFIMQGRLRAVTATTGLGVVGLLLPPLALVSSAAVGLVGLRAGWQQALIIAVLAAAVITGMVAVAGLPLPLGILTAVIQWAPMLLFAEILRRSSSWDWVLHIGMALGIGVVLLMYLLVPDLSGFWIRVLEQSVGQIFQQTGMPAADRELAFQQVASLMTGMVAAISVLSFVLALLLSRYWQALLYNPGGFGAEFKALRLNKVFAGLLVALLLLAWLAEITLFFELALVLLVGFFLHGLAVLHAVNTLLSLSRFWLVGAYVVMALALPQMMIVLATVGMLDSVIDLRGRLDRSGSV